MDSKRLTERDDGSTERRYRLIEPLGTGGMSVVWRAFDEVLERPVAVKLLAPKLLADPRSRQRIQAEARAAALLSHPNIAQVYDFGHGPGGAPYVVMELVTGRSLAEAGPLTPAELLRVGAQLADALAAVHARGLVHRDVKPANVMLTDGGAKLVDFGISAIAGDDSDLRDEILGTPAYLAPERLRGLPTTAATDVYALGMLLYRALSGHFPWPDDTTTAEVLEAHRRARPEQLPARLVTAPVARAIASCLAKFPENRPSAADMAETLAAAVHRVSPSASSARRMADRMSRTSGGRLTAAGVVAAAAVSGLAMCSGNGDAATNPAPMSMKAEPAAARPAPSGSAPAAPSPAAVDCAVQYSVRDGGSGAFTADLRLTAAGSDGGWSLTFRVPAGQAIGAVNGVTWSQEGDTVLLRGADLAADLSSGATFALAGASHDSAALPTDFALNGAGCRSVLMAQTAAPPAPAPHTANGHDSKKPRKGKGKQDD